MHSEKEEMKRKMWKTRSRRAAILGKARYAMRQWRRQEKARAAAKGQKSGNAHMRAFSPSGYDPEMLYVECGRCGSPVLWDEGRATQLLSQAGIDPLELDSSCILITDACPACGAKDEYAVRIFRISPTPASALPPLHGNA